MENKVHKGLREALLESKTSYVLITCEEPQADGGMQVELSYQGDECLAAYLVDHAQAFLDDQISMSAEI